MCDDKSLKMHSGMEIRLLLGTNFFFSNIGNWNDEMIKTLSRLYIFQKFW